MFDKVLGIPAHPLLIHAAVVFIPLLVVGAIVYPLWPAARPRIGWAVTALSVVGPFSALFAFLSGRAFKARLIKDKVASPTILSKVTQHQSFGTNTMWFTIALGVVTLALIVYTWRIARAGRTVPSAVWMGGAVLTIILGVITGYYVFRTGDTGAHIAWGGY